MNNLNQTAVIGTLQDLYRGKFKPVFDAIQRRKNNITELQAEKLASDVHLPGAAPYLIYRLVLDFFKSMQKLGVGDFRAGRRGKPTRFIWSVPMLDVLRAATGTGRIEPFPLPRAHVESVRDASGISPGNPNGISDDRECVQTDSVSYQFLIRPGFAVKLELPHDFSQSEADRFCKFIQALPLEHQAKL